MGDEARQYNEMEEQRLEDGNEENPVAYVIVVSDSEQDETRNRIRERPADDSDDEVAAKQARLEAPAETQAKTDDSGDDSMNGEICPICMDVWSNAGNHRLCSLRCGHLFGLSCVMKWLQTACTAGNRRCPQCNQKATVKEIRILYARKLSVVDTVEIEKLKEELAIVSTEKNRLEMEVSKCHLRQKMYEQQVDNLTTRIAQLEREQSEMRVNFNESVSRGSGVKFYLEKTLEISKDGDCRVLDYNPWHTCLVLSQKKETGIFSGYGIRKVNVEVSQLGQYAVLHQQAIRDIAFHPTEQTLMLTVSFDKTVKILDIRNNRIVHYYPTDSQLWSGCWSNDNSNILLVGAQNGSITEFDIRQTSGGVGTHQNPGDRSPVVSLATIPSNSAPGMNRGGFIAAHLNSCYAYEHKDLSAWTTRQMLLDGPFVSVRYDDKNHHALVSSRPNSRIPNARHVVFTIEKGTEEALLCNVVHSFNGGNSLQTLSRPCYVHVGNDTFVAAHQESTKCIPLWSVASGKQMYSLPISDPVLDMRSFAINNNIFLATLSSTKLRLYNHG